jgi:hypothetical protein
MSRILGVGVSGEKRGRKSGGKCVKIETKQGKFEMVPVD